ncbi:MAG: hypothetical protein JWN46_357 [Acidimicrobiales bacterium]|nr:hypothetical protein [Acidimicrobiales bacterium]
MPELLLESTSPYRTRHASVLRGGGDVYLFLADLTAGDQGATATGVWVANEAPAVSTFAASNPADPGAPPRMTAEGTLHPQGCPPFNGRLELVWFEEGDGVALLDADGVLAVVPGWAGTRGFSGYARHASAETPLAWPMPDAAREALEAKAAASRGFWEWRLDGSWDGLRRSGLEHLETRIGPADHIWPIDGGRFPEIIASRHRVSGHQICVTATTGISSQRMAVVEQVFDEPAAASRIELAIARTNADEHGAALLAGLAAIPFGRCTWLGDGHMVGGQPGDYPAFGADKAGILLACAPPPFGDLAPVDLSGRVLRHDPISYLWALVVDEAVLDAARQRGTDAALQVLHGQGGSWVH